MARSPNQHAMASGLHEPGIAGDIRRQNSGQSLIDARVRHE